MHFSFNTDGTVQDIHMYIDCERGAAESALDTQEYSNNVLLKNYKVSARASLFLGRMTMMTSAWQLIL